MDVFVFRSERYDRQFGFTLDREGMTLPAQLGPWRFPGVNIPSVILNVQPIGRWGIVLFGIELDGLYMLRADDDEIVALTAGRV